MSRELHDHYFKLAKREGYRSRAAYKLLEINERRRVLSAGDAVLDCGAAPGSWLQAAASIVGPRGVVVGIDLKAIDASDLPENVRVVEGDLNEVPADDLVALAAANHGGEPRPFDVILSDMAPDTTGERTMDHHRSIRLCELVLERAETCLRSGGNLVMKVFEGPAYRDLLSRCMCSFETARGVSPKASRQVSTEMYIVAQGYHGPISHTERRADERSADDPAFELPKGRPSRGWKKSR